MKNLMLPIIIGIFSTNLAFSQNSSLKESMQRGSDIYADFCVTCHLAKGEGVANAFPPLAGSDYLFKNREASIRGVKFGQQGELIVNGVTYNNVMAPMGLEDGEIADVMNFIMNSWGNESDSMVTTEEVAGIRKK
ncbi:MAG: c-type cytochrome [Flavobacteriaceae bacterium]